MPSYRNQSVETGFFANQLTGFYMMATLAFNKLSALIIYLKKGIYNQYHDYLIIPRCFFERGFSLKHFAREMGAYWTGCLIQLWGFNRRFIIIVYENSNNENNNNQNNSNKMVLVKIISMRGIVTMWEKLFIPNVSNFLKPFSVSMLKQTLKTN